MAKPLYTPLVNNNDDTVQLSEIKVGPGDQVKCGDVVAAVETDKSMLEVAAEYDGYVLEIRYAVGDQAEVGSVLMWLGDSPDEPIPEDLSEAEPDATKSNQSLPTAKAQALLRRYDLVAGEVPAMGERLSASDVEAYALRKGLVGTDPNPVKNKLPAPRVPGKRVSLAPAEHGMLSTVSWHRDEAAAAYLETDYDLAPWDRLAADFAAQQGLMMSPLLSLMAYRLVQLSLERPKINSTIFDDQRYQYDQVNLGFTVQAGDVLYLTVTQDSGSLDVTEFVQRLGEVQRRAMAHKLAADETQGATISFSSMSRWKVTRHMPILPPQTALIIAHAANNSDGRGVLGASYDHRVLSGFDVVRLLKDLAKPPQLDLLD